MYERPKIAVPLTLIDKVIETIAIVLLLALWIITLSNYASLPTTIPTHFNMAGEADGFGNKVSILSLPLISTIIYVGITLLNRYPHLYNYPGTITMENALRSYTSAARVMRVLKLLVLVVFLYIVYSTISTVNENKGAGRWFLPIIIIFLIVPNLFFFIHGRQKK